MDSQNSKLRDLKNKIRNPQAALALRKQLSETRDTRPRYDPDAFLDFVKDNPAFRNMHTVEDED